MTDLPPFLASHVRPREGFRPAYLETYESGALAAKVEEALEALRSCRVCPRDCDVDRLADERAVCKTGRHARVSSAFPHFGEEDCLRGWRGSGTIFFSQCNLRCVFCQKFDISWQGQGEEMDAREIQVTARPDRYEEIGRRTSPTEVLEAVQPARRAGLTRIDERWRGRRGGLAVVV